MPTTHSHCGQVKRPQHQIRAISVACGLAAAFAPAAALADPILAVEALYRGDVMGVVRGGSDQGARYLDNLDIVADADLDPAIGLRGTTLHAHLLSNLGGMPNDLAGSIQGINNIEVSRHRAKLFQLWMEHTLGDNASILAGLYDLNSEFYANDAAGLLIAPAFGIGSELSATGPNGPSIFPSTALTVRLRIKHDRWFAQAALLDANASSPGDPHGVSLLGRHGLLAIGEAGIEDDKRKLSIGAWRYTERQPAILPSGRTKAVSQGAYVIAQTTIAGGPDAAHHLRGFFRAGLSDAHTTPFSGGWQAGVLLERPFASRPDSALSVGVNTAYLSPRYRRATPVGEVAPPRSETGFEITYSDRILPHVSIQPDLQYVLNPAGGGAVRDAVVVGLRFQIDFSFGVPPD